MAGVERSEPPEDNGLGAHCVRPQPPNMGFETASCLQTRKRPRSHFPKGSEQRNRLSHHRVSRKLTEDRTSCHRASRCESTPLSSLSPFSSLLSILDRQYKGKTSVTKIHLKLDVHRFNHLPCFCSTNLVSGVIKGIRKTSPRHWHLNPDTQTEE